MYVDHHHVAPVRPAGAVSRDVIGCQRGAHECTCITHAAEPRLCETARKNLLRSRLAQIMAARIMYDYECLLCDKIICNEISVAPR